MLKTGVSILLCLVVSSLAFAERNVNFTGSFESGKILANWSSTDGFFMHTVPIEQIGSLSVASNQGGFGPDTKLDTRVVSSDVVGGDIVQPRSGKFFVRSALYFEKSYIELNSGLNKPRSKIYPNHENHKYDFDVEGYLGFSIYLPRNFEHETGVTDSRGSVQLYQGMTASAAYTPWALRIYVPGGNVAHWIPYLNVNDRSVKSGGKREFDLGPVTDDLGKWTDFIVRYRMNPFSTTTNPAKSGIAMSKDQVYEGNKGIFQMWKSVGDADEYGNRKMQLVIDLENQPVGIVPHATERIKHLFRVYKYGWHNNPTTVKGPVWVGFDEIRDGRVIANGTQYSDVHPLQRLCTDSCPEKSFVGGDPQPSPPENLAIVQ
jgi:hypothetical protein